MEKKGAVVGWIITVLSAFKQFKGKTGVYAFIMMENPLSKLKQSEDQGKKNDQKPEKPVLFLRELR